jgi:hypothetical protein
MDMALSPSGKAMVLHTIMRRFDSVKGYHIQEEHMAFIGELAYEKIDKTSSLGLQKYRLTRFERTIVLSRQQALKQTLLPYQKFSSCSNQKTQDGHEQQLFTIRLVDWLAQRK